MHRGHGAGFRIHEEDWELPNKAQIVEATEMEEEQQKGAKWDMLENIVIKNMSFFDKYLFLQATQGNGKSDKRFCASTLI